MIGKYLVQILENLGLESSEFVPAEPQGIANETWLCGDWVVRISKDPEYLEDLFTESVAAPVAFRAGVRSAEPLHFSLSPTGEIPPFSVYQRVQGRPLSRAVELAQAPRFFRAYGAELRKVHSIREVDDPKGYLDEPWELEAESLLRSAEDFGLKREVERLLPSLESLGRAFVHQDLHADNVLVDEEGLPVFLDWGDAGFGDPAADFRYLPAEYLPVVLEGYGVSDQALINRIRLHIFDQHVYCQKMARTYGRYGESSRESLSALLKEP